MYRDIRADMLSELLNINGERRAYHAVSPGELRPNSRSNRVVKTLAELLAKELSTLGIGLETF